MYDTEKGISNCSKICRNTPNYIRKAVAKVE